MKKVSQSKPDGRHEQRDRRLVDQRPQDDALDQQAQYNHRCERERQREPEVEAVLDQAHAGQRRKEHHRALREVEHARSLVDQHEADRHQRVHDSGKESADQDFEEELHGVST